MKSQMSKPRHTREKYTEEYKAQALKLWRESIRSDGVRPIGVIKCKGMRVLPRFLYESLRLSA